MRRSLSFILVVCISLSVAVGGMVAVASEAQAQDVTISYSFFAPPVGFPHAHIEEWTHELDRRTEVDVNVEVHYGGALLGAGETYSGVRAGVADAGMSLTSYDPRGFPLMSVFSLPLHMPNSTVASQVVWDIIKEFDPGPLQNVEVLAAFATEPAYIQSSQPVHSLGDLRGMEMRTRGASIPIAEALGISAQGMPMPEVPEALERGIIEGNITSREVLMDFKLAEFLPYVVDYPTDVGVFVAVMNQQKWDTLPDEVQSTIKEMRREMSVWTGAYNDFIHTQNALRWSKAHHGLEIIELSEEERQRWDERLEPLVEDWIERQEDRGLPAQEVVDRVLELRDHYSEKWTLMEIEE